VAANLSRPTRPVTTFIEGNHAKNDGFGWFSDVGGEVTTPEVGSYGVKCSQACLT